MKPPGAWGYAFYLAWFSFWCVAALALFSRGFFLSRRALPDVSECVPLYKFTCEGLPSNESHTCSDDARISAILRRADSPLVCGVEPMRVVLVVVDALRYDFAEYDEELERPLAYQNMLPIVKKLLRYPEKARLFRFVADPPTTTLQRLKGLMTGSLPTFIDAGANFATPEIMEDNLIDQVVSGGGSAVLLGDDTWLRLFPGRWRRSHALYSFHTWDLDTVDTEVDSKIYAELQKDDWQLLVAHYLGVDHAGHRYGPHHLEMSRKLRELDDRLEKLVMELPDDAVLCVIGDHGMTETGDHGGESSLEVTAALLVYAGAGLAWSAPTGQVVRQTELAATLATVLGRTPPAPSLGLLVPAALPAHHERARRATLLALVSNLDQVVRYTERYAEVSEDLDTVRLRAVTSPYAELRARAAHIHTEQEFLEYAQDVKALVEAVRELCRTAWVQFDSLAMMRGCLILVMAVFLNYLLVEGLPAVSITPVFQSSFVPCAYIGTFVAGGTALALRSAAVLDEAGHAALLGAGLSATAVLSVLIVMHWDGVAERWYGARDAATHERLARAALVASAAALLSNSYIIEEGSVAVFLLLGVLGAACRAAGASRDLLLLWLGVGVALLATRPYRACREEQGSCWTVSGTGAGAGAADGGASGRAGVLLAMLLLGATVAAVRHWSGAFANSAWRYLPAVAAVCVCGHWAVAWGGAGAARRSRFLARSAWSILGLLLTVLLTQPGSARMALVRMSLLLHVAWTLTLGTAAAAPAALLFAAAALTLALMAELRRSLATKLGDARCDTAGAVIWSLLATYSLYGTGHHATLAHVRWSAAFHAGHLATEHDMPRLLAAVFILLNTFGGHLMFGVATPLLVLWRARGEPATEKARMPLAAIFSVCLKFQLCFSVRLLGCMMAATVHCRHLMVWSVFAPKLMYEAGGAVAALLGATLGFLLVLRACRIVRVSNVDEYSAAFDVS